MATKSVSAKTLRRRSKKCGVPFVPHKYQEKAIAHLLAHPKAGLFLDPGLGKTAITLAAFDILREEKLTGGMLVVAPLRVAHSVWPAEVKAWQEFSHLSVAVLHGRHKEKLAKEPHDIYVVNYDGLPWLIQSGAMQHLLQQGVDMLVFDELSKMKDHGTKRFKLMKPWLQKFRRRVGLTGSPAANGYMDLFGQMYCLDRGERLGQYVTHFRYNYFLPDGPYKWRLKPGAEEQIRNLIKDIVLSMSAEDYLELPPVSEVRVEVELPPKVRKIYKEVEDDLFTLLASGEVLTAPNVASAISKCKQIANGAVYLGSVDPVTGEPVKDKKWEELHKEKVDALVDLVDELQGQQVLIAYEYKHDLERLLKALGKDTPYIGGGTNAKEAARIEKAWNEGEIRVLLGHPQSIGHGLNLQKSGASNVAWFSPTWNYELYDQFNRRIRRQGSTADRIRIFHFVAKDTVDIDVINALRRKGSAQERLMEALKERMR